MSHLLLVGLGGFLGSVARYALGGLVHRHLNGGFPYGTLIVNILGCFAIGVFMHLVEGRGALRPETRLFVGIGLLGGFTTFSSFGYETVELLRAGEHVRTALNVAANITLGVGSVWLGRSLMKLLGA
ncbi:MAG: fluoride efflux transporter CrcB [Planctomycetes bacterium]|nr:fluoride efflux transporter CrcB [Planctomycetota bacterium]